MPSGVWKPSRVERCINALATGAGVIEVETDQGHGFLKAMGYKSGPHVLAREWLITSLAEWFGLPTLDYALIDVTADDEIRFADGRPAQPGKGFVTRRETKIDFLGKAKRLSDLTNHEDITRLIIFDTWVRNWDRYSPAQAGRKPVCNLDNVFLCERHEPGKLFLVAADFSHCLDRGDEIRADLNQIAKIRDSDIYGSFPAFLPYVQEEVGQAALQRLAEFSPKIFGEHIARLPAEWQVVPHVRQVVVDFLHRRAQFLTTHLRSIDMITKQPTLGKQLTLTGM